MAVSRNSGSLFVGVLIPRALLTLIFGLYIAAPHFLETPM